jgi:hypothetical protein
VPRPVRRQPPRDTAAAEDPAIDALVKPVADEQLRHRLGNFGRAIKARKPL